MINTSPKLNGEPTAHSLANGLATLGRYGDSYMVHAAEGETVVPGEILDANPQLRNELFGQMRAMGIEDPNRYVVGNTLNSINPVTGQPEFFFKKIFRAIKKVFKKVAPTALALVGNWIAPGVGGPIGAALGTKLSGGSWKDALKSGAIAWGTQGLMKGIQGAQATGAGQGGIGGFFRGAGEGLMQPIQGVGGMFGMEGLANPLQQGIFGDQFQGDFFADYDPRLKPDPGMTAMSGSVAGSGGITHQVRGEPGSWVKTGAGQPAYVNERTGRMLKSMDASNAFKGGPAGARDALIQSNLVGPSAGGSVVPGGAGVKVLPRGVDVAKKPDLSFWEKMQTPEVLGPTTAALAPAALTYAFADEKKPPTPEELAQLTDPQRSAYEQYTAMTAEQRQSAAGQSLFNEWYGPLQNTREQLVASTGITSQQAASSIAKMGGVPGTGISQLPGLQLPSVMGPLSVTAAAGGEISGPGTGRSDSIPALLSDGEFVMTAEAVRNAGNGDRDRGAARMYDIMHGFEGRA